MMAGLTVALAGTVVAVTEDPAGPHERPSRPGSSLAVLPARPASYFGLYAKGAPSSYRGVASFTKATGVMPDLALYYSGWYEPFQAKFATAATRHGAVPVVQINPAGVSVAAIASGHFDAYLRSYATAVRSYRRPVVLSFGHEMNGRWYSWGYGHTSPAVFVAAWQHIVSVFRAAGARNVTWMWTVNTIEPKGNLVPDPAAWWPGSSYVNWVGIDGYFHKSSAQFASVFGPTIVRVRELTRDPVLIAETGAPRDTGQPRKIAALFAGVRAYGLLGFVWFDEVGRWDYRLSSPAAMAAFRIAAKSYNMQVFNRSSN
jgi:mannan endo-1,4-beta-mannosidase